MNETEWLNTIEPEVTANGARLDLRIYVYPDDHGNIYVKSDEGAGRPVKDVGQAARLFGALWQKVSRANTPEQSDDKVARLDELLSRVTPENIHGEVDVDKPVGRELW